MSDEWDPDIESILTRFPRGAPADGGELRAMLIEAWQFGSAGAVAKVVESATAGFLQVRVVDPDNDRAVSILAMPVPPGVPIALDVVYPSGRRARYTPELD